MAIFIISNRETKTVDGELRFKNDADRRARHDFRIAEYDAQSGHYDIISDLDEDGYEGVAKDEDKPLNGSSYLFKNLYASNIDKDKRGDILFFIHGFDYKFENNLKHINTINELYLGNDSPIKHLVYVSWPSQGNILKYKDDQRDARETGRMLGRFFEKVRRFFIDAFEIDKNEPCRHRIHLAAHSLGNQVLYYMLKTMDDSQLFPLFSECTLFNSDVTYDAFDPGQPFSLLPQISERCHMYINKSDDALWISDNTKGNSKRLGRRGPRDRANLPEETYVVDTSELRGGGITEELFDHWGYLRRKEVISDVRAVYAGVEEDEISGRQKIAQANSFKLLDR